MESKNGKCLQILSITLSVTALVVSLVLLVLTLMDNTDPNQEIEILRNRLEDLETEHDYILEKETSITADPLIGPPDFCSLLPDPGPCGSQVSRWYFLPKEGDCIQFPWGGCQGNDNNFVSLDQCRAACNVPLTHQSSTKHTQVNLPTTVPTVQYLRENFSPDDCTLAPDSGPCQDRVTRFYYDGAECQRFQYGGCSGNDNNFFSLSECERHCGKGNTDKLMSRRENIETGVRKRHRKDSCSLPQDPGTCSGSHTRFNWNLESQECEAFKWSGCGGNSNNFRTREKCWKRCGGKV